jgi:voltage-gated potassium channel
MEVPSEAAVELERAGHFDRFSRAVELPLALLALLIVPALVLENHAQSLGVREAATFLNWLVWLAFCSEYAVKAFFAPARLRFIKEHWFDLLIICLSPPFLVPAALQGTRAVRAVRLLRLLRFVRAAAVAAMGLRMARDALRHRRFHYVLLATLVIVSLGAISIFALEHSTNKGIATLDDAFWWAVVTTTTVGYGDVSPVTGEGRIVAVLLMLFGIGFLGVLTATITSFFFDYEQNAREAELRERLARMEAKLDALIAGRTPFDRADRSPAESESKPGSAGKL